jgi:hypothetical protein
MNHRIVIAATCSLLLIAATGCQKTTPPTQPPYAGGSMASYSWSPTVADRHPVPGIDQAYLCAWWVGNKPALLIWADVEKPHGSSVATPDGGFDGRLNDIPIKFHRKTKTVTIDGTDYDTAKGSVFLISTREGKPVLKQLNRNVAALDILKADQTGIDNTKLKALARADADISAFFAGSADNPNAP